MSAERALFAAVQEWRRLARACHTAIGKRDWNFLLQCQKRVGSIQPSIPNLSREARKEWQRSHANLAAKEKELRALVLELQALVESNQKLLRATKALALAERKKLEQTVLNLKRLQNSYGPASPPAWTSFS